MMLLTNLTIDDFYTSNGVPRRCPFCCGTAMSGEIVAMDASVASEVRYRCTLCKEEIGYFAYGSFEPHHRDDTIRRLAEGMPERKAPMSNKRPSCPSWGSW